MLTIELVILLGLQIGGMLLFEWPWWMLFVLIAGVVLLGFVMMSVFLIYRAIMLRKHKDWQYAPKDK